MTVTSAWAALQDALAAKTPLCSDDSRFIGDGRSAALTRELAVLCGACPVLDQCRDYSHTASPHTMAGFWAGSWRGKPVKQI